MENKMATPLGTTFSTAEKEVLQCDNKALGSLAEQLIIKFDQEKFKEFLSQGKQSPTSMCKHRRAYVAKIAIDGNLASSEAPQALSRLNPVMDRPTLVSVETEIMPN